MRFSTLLKNPADWMQAGGPHSEIVMTSRVRLARNLRGMMFPGWGQKGDRQHVLERVRPAIDGLAEMKSAFSTELSALTAIQKGVLVERHLISREHAARGAGSGVVMNRKQTVCIMINEEDHLRMQAIRAGLNLRAAHKHIDRIDSKIEESLDYAFDDRLGYLTACPTNLGPAMRASAMLHLPALVLGEQMNQVVQAVNKIGLAVRGHYGEGSEALGNLFQISNQNTLGEKENEIIARLEKVIEQIIGHEMNARATLVEDSAPMLLDQIGRAYAILRHAYVITSKDALNLLSMLRLGADLKCFPPETRHTIDMLLMEIQPNHLQVEAKSKLSAEKRDASRAESLRRQLKSLSEPDISIIVGSGGDSPPAASPS